MSALSRFGVVELSESAADEYCGKAPSDFSAGVMKVERPGCGRPTRRPGPLVAHGAVEERSGLIVSLKTNKSSVRDISRAEGLAIQKELPTHAGAQPIMRTLKPR